MPPRAASRSCCAGSAATRRDLGRSLRWPPSRGASCGRASSRWPRCRSGRSGRARRLVPVRLVRASPRRPRARTHGSNCASRSGSSGRGVPSGGRGRRRSCRGCRSTGIRTCLGGRVTGSGWDGAMVYAEKNWGPRFTEHWWWGQAQAFEGADACVAFAGGRVLGGAPTGVVVRVEDRVLRLAPPFARVRTAVGEAGWRVRARSPRWDGRDRGRGRGLAGGPAGPGARRAPGRAALPAVPHRPPPRDRPAARVWWSANPRSPARALAVGPANVKAAG